MSNEITITDTMKAEANAFGKSVIENLKPVLNNWELKQGATYYYKSELAFKITPSFLLYNRDNNGKYHKCKHKTPCSCIYKPIITLSLIDKSNYEMAKIQIESAWEEDKIVSKTKNFSYTLAFIEKQLLFKEAIQRKSKVKIKTTYGDKTIIREVVPIEMTSETELKALCVASGEEKSFSIGYYEFAEKDEIPNYNPDYIQDRFSTQRDEDEDDDYEYDDEDDDEDDDDEVEYKKPRKKKDDFDEEEINVSANDVLNIVFGIIFIISLIVLWISGGMSTAGWVMAIISILSVLGRVIYYIKNKIVGNSIFYILLLFSLIFIVSKCTPDKTDEPITKIQYENIHGGHNEKEKET